MSSKQPTLLIDDYPLMVQPMLAAVIGLCEATVIQRLKFRLTHDYNTVVHEGRTWYFQTREGWVKEFIVFADVTLDRYFDRLVELGLIYVAMPFAAVGDTRKWYTINDAAIAAIEAQLVDAAALGLHYRDRKIKKDEYTRRLQALTLSTVDTTIVEQFRPSDSRSERSAQILERRKKPLIMSPPDMISGGDQLDATSAPDMISGGDQLDATSAPDMISHVKELKNQKKQASSPSADAAFFDDGDGSPEDVSDGEHVPPPYSAPPPPAPTATEQLLAARGITTAAEFAHLDEAAVRERLAQLGTANNAMVVANLRKYPPRPSPAPVLSQQPPAPEAVSDDEAWFLGLPPDAQRQIAQSAPRFAKLLEAA